MLLHAFIISGLIVLSLAACSEEAPTVGEVKEFAAVCQEANKGKRIAVDGYLRLPDSFSGDSSVVLRLYETAEFAGETIGVQTKIGPEANQMENVPTTYSDEDLKVHLADGQVAGLGAKVKVSGQVYFPIVEQVFACGLENPLIEQIN
jgi:hypothetical protein